MPVILKSPKEVEKMRASGRLVRRVLDRLTEVCKPGVTTLQLDEEAVRVITDAGGTSLFKGYQMQGVGTPFPSNVCISINEVVVHGFASDRAIVDGDVVSVDCGVLLDGWCGDAATTILVGDVPPPTRALCETTQQVLELAVEHMKAGRLWSQIARIMQRHAEAKGYGVVRQFVGHGLGRKLHEDPQVPNFVNRDLIKKDIKLRPGLVLAIEPMLNLGDKEAEVLPDGWTVVTADRQPSAHYEHTIAITHNGADVLTDGR